MVLFHRFGIFPVRESDQHRMTRGSPVTCRLSFARKSWWGPFLGLVLACVVEFPNLDLLRLLPQRIIVTLFKITQVISRKLSSVGALDQ